MRAVMMYVVHPLIRAAAIVVAVSVINAVTKSVVMLMTIAAMN